VEFELNSAPGLLSRLWAPNFSRASLFRSRRLRWRWTSETPLPWPRRRHHPSMPQRRSARRGLAVAAGKPRTGEAGLKAIHAVLHRSCFSKESLAWEFYGTSRQRFYEWKPKVGQHRGLESAAQAPPPDDDAVTAARERKSQLQRQRRHDEAAVRDLVTDLITLVEQQASSDTRVKSLRHSLARQSRDNVGKIRPWSCPFLCASPATCARAAWRKQCTPGDDEIRRALLERWREEQGLLDFGHFCGPSGYRYQRVEKQMQFFEEQEAEVVEPVFEEREVSCPPRPALHDHGAL
jgi:hypothetical protein